MTDFEIYRIDFDYFEKLLGINSQSKERPALVVTSKFLGKPIFYPLTTTSRDKHYAIRDWKEAGLSKQSYIVFDQGRELSKNKNMTFVGKLTEYDIQRIKSERLLKEMKEDKNLPDVAEENIIDQEDAGISALFIDAINECWSAIDMYNGMIVTLDSLDRHEFDETLLGLLADRNREVGALQGILELLSPVIDQIDIGRSEAQSEVAFDTVEESLNEAEDGKGHSERRVIITTKPIPERKFRNDVYIQIKKEDDFEKVVRTALRMAPEVVVFDDLDFLYENPNTKDQFVAMKKLVRDTGHQLVEESYSINEGE